jgi:hypothetical protein
MIIFAKIKETTIEAENTPIPLRRITSGRIHFTLRKMSASGRTTITKNTDMCEMS